MEDLQQPRQTVDSERIPELLRSGLQVVAANRMQKPYVLRDSATGRMHAFTVVEYYILDQLSYYGEFDALALAYHEAFSENLTEAQLAAFVEAIDDAGLWSRSALHNPIVGSYLEELNARRADRWRNRRVKPGSLRQLPQSPAVLPGKSASHSVTVSSSHRSPVGHRVDWDAVAGQDAGSAGEQVGGAPAKQGLFPLLNLFNPEALMDDLLPFFKPLGKLCLWLIPFLLVNAAFLLGHHLEMVSAEFNRLFKLTSLFAHSIISLLVVNLFSALALGMVARFHRVGVKSLSIVLFFWVLPRFMVVPEVKGSTSRSARLWMAVTPLLVKLFLLGAGFLLWYLTRSVDNALPAFFFNMSCIAGMAFLFTANPLFASNGYQLLATLLDEPFLRTKAMASLRSRVSRRAAPDGSKNLFAIYGLSCLLFTVIMVGFFLSILAVYLKQQFSTTGITIFVIFTSFLLFRMYSSVRSDGARQPLGQVQTVPGVHRKPTVLPTQNQLQHRKPRAVLKVATIMLLAGVMYLPYDYEANGEMILKPLDHYELTTDLEGIVEAVYYEGGEYVEKGQLVAKLESSEAEAQVKILNARIKSQQAVLDDLRSGATAEQRRVAQRKLDVELTKLAFSKENLARKRAIYKKAVISLEEFQNAQRAYEVDLGNVERARADLELVNSGASSDALLAAESELQRWVEERDLYQNRVDRSHLYMPIDGKIITLYLKQKTGQFLVEGEPFAEVENTSQVLGEIEIPEVDIGIINVGSSIKVRVWAYHDELFTGQVVKVDTNVEGREFGNIVRVITLLDNEHQKLRTGMTGYAKISGETRPLWEVLFLTVKRFVLVEMWSWLP